MTIVEQDDRAHTHTLQHASRLAQESCAKEHGSREGGGGDGASTSTGDNANVAELLREHV